LISTLFGPLLGVGLGAKSRKQKSQRNGSETLGRTTGLGVVSVTAPPGRQTAERVFSGAFAPLSEAGETTLVSWAPIVADGPGPLED
jgi:hypothetical protein